MAGDSNIPLEAVLKVAVNQMGGDSVKQFLENYTGKLKEGEESVSRTSSMLGDVADHVGRIGEGMRALGGMVGLAGAGAVAQQFMAASGAGAGLAMSQGHLTGSDSVYGNYAQSLLGVQAQTGVAYSQIEEGLRTAAQMVGGNLSPQGAARFGALLAGAGLAGGLSTQAIGSIVGSLMESSGTSMGGANGEQATTSDTAVLAGVTQALSSFQGTQVGAMLPTVASLYEQQSFRSGAGGPKQGVAQTAGFVNALAEANPLFRNAQNVEAAIEGGNSYLLSGLTNPMVRFSEARAGIGINEAIEGGPEALEKLAVGLREQLPGQTFREALRSQLPAQTAKMMEEVVNHPGLMREAKRKALEAQTNPNIAGYEEDIHKSLASQTPEKELLKIGAQALGLVEGGEMGLTHLLGSPAAAMGATVLGGGYVGSLGLRGISAAAQGTIGLAGDAFAGVGLGGALAETGGLAAVPYAAAAVGRGLQEPASAQSALTLPQLEALRKLGIAGPLGKILEAPANAISRGASALIQHPVGAIEDAAEGWGHMLFGTTTHAEQQSQRAENERFRKMFVEANPLGVHAGQLHVGSQALHGLIGSASEQAEKHFGTSEWQGKAGAQKYLDELLTAQQDKGLLGGWAEKHLSLTEETGGGLQKLTKALIKPANTMLGEEKKYQELGPEAFWQQKFGESVGKFSEAVEKMLKTGSTHKDTSYEGGGLMHDTGYSPLSAALATAPGTVYAAYLKGGGRSTGTSGGASTSDASYEQAGGLHLSGAVGKWERLIKEAHAANPSVPESLIAAVMTGESGGKARALSSAGAEGLMQLMPETAAGLGVRNPDNARENVMGGAKLLAELLKANKGSITGALEGYNPGAPGSGGGAEYAHYIEGFLRSIESHLHKIEQSTKRTETRQRRAKGTVS